MSKRKLPKSIHVTTFFVVVGPSNEPMTCAGFETDTGLQLRLSYADGSAMQTESFPAGLDLADRIAAKAEEWKRAWVEKGFTEIGV